MDAVTQKFSVFDFFNLLIAGTIFGSALVLCHYPQSISIIEEASYIISDSSFLLIIFFILYISYTLVLGMIFQVIGHWFIKEKIGWEYKLIGTCLKGGIFGNTIRINRLCNKACEFFQLTKEELNENTTATFVAYCVYYLHIRGLDYKTEKLRETQGLSELFTCIFWFTPLISISIFVLQMIVGCNIDFNWGYSIVTYSLCIILGFMFYYRYKVSSRNRIRMVLSIYDASTEKSEENNI